VKKGKAKLRNKGTGFQHVSRQASTQTNKHQSESVEHNISYVKKKNLLIPSGEKKKTGLADYFRRILCTRQKGGDSFTGKPCAIDARKKHGAPATTLTNRPLLQSGKRMSRASKFWLTTTQVEGELAANGKPSYRRKADAERGSSQKVVLRSRPESKWKTSQDLHRNGPGKKGTKKKSPSENFWVNTPEASPLV